MMLYDTSSNKRDRGLARDFVTGLLRRCSCVIVPDTRAFRVFVLLSSQLVQSSTMPKAVLRFDYIFPT